MEIKHRGETYQVDGIYHPCVLPQATSNGSTSYEPETFELTTIILDKVLTPSLYGVNLLQVIINLRDYDAITLLALEAYHNQRDEDYMAREREE